jgi:hypothetical protein
MYRSFYDESDDVQHYRRVHIISRKRRKVWHDPAPATQSQPYGSPKLDTESVVVPTSSIHLEPTTENDALNGLEDILDTNTFEQILEMDDDADDRDFSRCIILDGFSQMNTAIERLRPLVYDPDSNLRDISSLGHLMKGQPATLGLCNLANLQFNGRNPVRNV